MYHGGDEWRPKLTDRLHDYIVFYKQPNPLDFPNSKPPYLSPAEKYYLMMYRALEDWHVVPWIDPITKEEYPEVKWSMFRIREFSIKRQHKDQREAEQKSRLK